MAAVALSSLRVSMDGDAGGYVRAAQQKVDADNKMIASDRARNVALAQADATLAKAIPGMAALSRSLLDGYGAGAAFEAQIRKIGNAVDRGMGLDRAEVLLDGVYRKFGLTADAAALAEKGFVSIAPAVDALNGRMAAAAENAQRLQANIRAQNFQQSINTSFGIGANDNSASRAADVAALGESLDNLRAKYSPLFAAQRDYLGTLKELQSLEAKTALTEVERAAAIQRTKDAFAAQVVGMRSASDETDKFGKSGSTAAQKLNQLGYQVNDIVGGLVSGQSPLTILAQQGTQISQIWTAGATTVTGALAAIGGVTVVAGIVAAAQAISNLRKEMVELGDAAQRTNVSTSNFQLLQAAGQYKGVSRDESAAAVQSLAAGLNQALKYSNDLSQLFAQNGASLKTQSGNAKNLVDILAQGADFVRNARTEQDKLLVVQQLGLSPTAEMVRYLEQGGTAIKLAMEDARLAGGVIDERLIRSAQAFDEKWTTATTNISLRMKAWLAETSDTLGKLADSPFFSKLVTAATMLPVIGTPIALGRSAYNAVAGAAAPSAVNDPQRRLEGSFQLVSAENDRVASSSRTKLTADTQKLLSIESQRIGLLGATATVDQQVRAAEIGLDQARLNGIDLTDKQRAAVLQLAREQALGITAMKQQADATRIQAETLGMSAGAAAEFTAVQTRLAEALRNKQALTDQDIAQIRAQAAALGQAAQAAEQARVRQDIRFGSATALLSPDDIQIAQQLKGLYPDVATALASVEAAGLRTNAALSQVSSTISGDLVTGITDALDGTKSFGQAFSDTSKLVIRAIEEMIVKLLVVGPLMRSLQSSFGGLTGGSGDFGSLFGSAGVTYGTPGAAGRNLFGPIAPSALGNIFSRGNIVPFARGGVVTRPTLFPMANGGTGLMGEAGPEAVMPLRRGADGRLGVSAGGIGGGAANDNGAAGSVVVNIYNAPSGSDPQTSVSRTNNGTQVDIMFKNAVTGLMVDDASRNGPISQAIAARQRGFRGA